MGQHEVPAAAASSSFVGTRLWSQVTWAGEERYSQFVFVPASGQPRQPSPHVLT